MRVIGTGYSEQAFVVLGIKQVHKLKIDVVFVVDLFPILPKGFRFLFALARRVAAITIHGAPILYGASLA
jgi:hypothetical protein